MLELQNTGCGQKLQPVYVCHQSTIWCLGTRYLKAPIEQVFLANLPLWLVCGSLPVGLYPTQTLCF